jgi:hypothetical protein
VIVLGASVFAACTSDRPIDESHVPTIAPTTDIGANEPIEVFVAQVSVHENWLCGGEVVMHGAPVHISGDVEPDGSWRVGGWGLAGIALGFTFSRDPARKTHVVADAVSTTHVSSGGSRDGATERAYIEDLRGEIYIRSPDWGSENIPIDCVFSLRGRRGNRPIMLMGGFSILVKPI